MMVPPLASIRWASGGSGGMEAAEAGMNDAAIANNDGGVGRGPRPRAGNQLPACDDHCSLR